nr:unnamed protein product [Callosobruchus analis]
MLPIPCAENITALRNGLDVTLVLFGGTKGSGKFVCDFC